MRRCHCINVNHGGYFLAAGYPGLCVCVYIYIYIYIYVCVCVYIYTHTPQTHTGNVCMCKVFVNVICIPVGNNIVHFVYS